MKRAIWVALFASLPFLAYSGIDRIGGLPGWDHVADVGKVATITSTGSLAWSYPGGTTGASGDLVVFSGASGGFADSGTPEANVVLVSRAVLAGTGLTVTNSGLLSADITLGMSTIDNQPLTVGGALIASGPLTVTGNTQLQGTLAVSGASTLVGNVQAQGTLAVSGATTFSNTITTSNGSYTCTAGNALCKIVLPTGGTGSLLINDASANNLATANASTQTIAIHGTNTNDNASAGYNGEQLGPISRLRASAAGLTSNTTCNVGATSCPSTGGTQSITLTAGDWEVRGLCVFLPAASTTITELDCAVTKSSATLPASSTIGVPASGEVWITNGFNALALGANDWTQAIPPFRVTVANGATTTIYLVQRGIFATSTMTGYGSMDARRIR